MARSVAGRVTSRSAYLTRPTVRAFPADGSEQLAKGRTLNPRDLHLRNAEPPVSFWVSPSLKRQHRTRCSRSSSSAFSARDWTRRAPAMLASAHRVEQRHLLIAATARLIEPGGLPRMSGLDRLEDLLGRELELVGKLGDGRQRRAPRSRCRSCQRPWPVLRARGAGAGSKRCRESAGAARRGWSVPRKRRKGDPGRDRSDRAP